MNIKEVHLPEKPVSALSIFKGNAVFFKILKDQLLKEHLPKTPALLVCVQANVLFENENGIQENLLPGDYVLIEEMVKHWVKGITDSQFLLFK